MAMVPVPVVFATLGALAFFWGIVLTGTVLTALFKHWPKRKLVRAYPRRSPARYDVGTTLRLADGRKFKVVEVQKREWVDPSHGRGGGNMETVTYHGWEQYW